MQAAYHRWGRRALASGVLALACLVLMPIAGYLAGKRVIGAYEGPLGLRDYFASIYAGAGTGDPAAWMLLLAPALIALVWWMVLSTWPKTSPDRPQS